jgi:hypothetical protein
MISAAWRTVAESKVVFVPIGEYIDKNGNVRTRFARTGIRLDMEDGSWWFKHFRFNTWTRHYKGKELCGVGFNGHVCEVEKKDNFSNRELYRTWKHAPSLISALEHGVEDAIVREAEERQERMVAARQKGADTRRAKKAAKQATEVKQPETKLFPPGLQGYNQAVTFLKSIGKSHSEARQAIKDVKGGNPLVVQTSEYDHLLYFQQDGSLELLPNLNKAA